MKIKQRSQNQLRNNARWHALLLLDRIEDHGDYSNVVLDNFLKQSSLGEERDNRLVVAMVYGVVQRKYTLDYYLAPLIAGKKVDDWVKNLLRLTLYQLLYLDRVPDHAAVNEAVEIAKTNGHDGLGKFVNALLRRFMRQDRLPLEEAIIDPVEYLSVAYSIAPWIVRYFSERMSSQQETESLLASLIETPHVSARVHQAKSVEEIRQSLYEEGCDVTLSPISDRGIIAVQGNFVRTTAFKQGWLTIQDESSMLVAPMGQLTGTEEVLDACTAPGGKATHIASLLTTGHLTALDVSAKKMERVKDHMKRMELADKVDLVVTDARSFQPEEQQRYDVIYVDAPCSGLGLMRRKPEIKYTKSQEDVTNLVKSQSEILDNVSHLLKPGGTLIYSTCTMTWEENEEQVAAFIATHDNFRVDPITTSELMVPDLLTKEGYIRVWPHQYHTDGFFIARIKDTRTI